MDELENKYLNKHVAAIHCSNNIGLLQRKIFNALLYKAYPKLLDDDFHYISLSEISKLIDYNSKDSSKLKQAFKSLQTTTVDWNIIEDGDTSDDEVWCSSTLLASSVIDRKRGFCRYEYSKTLATLLYQPNMYARIDLGIQNKFNSSYGLALYENCVRFKNVRTTGWIAIDTFRKLMGIADSKYSKFSDFNKRVLSPAIAEINKMSDINVDLQMNRVAQQVVSLKFTITIKKTIKPLGLNSKEIVSDYSQEKKSELQDLLKTRLHASQQDIATLISTYSEELIKSKINLMFESETYKKGLILSPLAFLKSALKNNYASPEKTSAIIENKKMKSASWEQKGQYDLYRQNYVLDKFSALSTKEQESIEKIFFQYLKNHGNLTYSTTVFSVYQSHGLSSVASEFSEFLSLQNKSFVSGLLSIKEFLLQKFETEIIRKPFEFKKTESA